MVVRQRVAAAKRVPGEGRLIFETGGSARVKAAHTGPIRCRAATFTGKKGSVPRQRANKVARITLAACLIRSNVRG